MVCRGSSWLSGLIACMLTSASYTASGADWPHWLGPHSRNAAETQHLPTNFDNVRWRADLGKVAFGCPTVVNGRIYVGTNAPGGERDPRLPKFRGGVLVCLDEQSGEVVWRFHVPVRWLGFPKNTHMPQQIYGICSSPTVEGDRLYIVSNGDDVLCMDVNGQADGNDGPFMEEGAFMSRDPENPTALTEQDGDILWRYDIPRELGVAPHDVGSCSVLIDGNVLYTSTSNGIGVGSPAGALKPNAPAFIALDKRDGSLIAVDGEGISERLFHAQWTSPTKGDVDGETLIFLGGGDGICYAYPALTDAEILAAKQRNKPMRMKSVWRFDCNPPHYKRDPSGNRIYYYQGDLRVYRNKRRTGQSTVGFNDGDGSFIGPSEILSSPVFHEGRIYVATGRDPLHGLGQGILHCIDATKTGDITNSGAIWSYEHIGRTLSTPAIANDLIYAADLAGRLHCLDMNTGEVQWIHDSEDEIWGNPLVADGKVYLMAKRSLTILNASRELNVLYTHPRGSEMGVIAANDALFAFIKGELFAVER